MSVDEEQEMWDAIVANAPDRVQQAIGPMAGKTKPPVRLVGTDGNVFALLGRCSQALRRAGYRAEADEMTGRVFQSGSYDEALGIMMEYVDAS